MIKIKNNLKIHKPPKDTSHLVFMDANKLIDTYNELIVKQKGGILYTTQLGKDFFCGICDNVLFMQSSLEFFRVSKQYDFNYVYLIKGTHNGKISYKIGKANDVQNRVRMFNVKIPFDIELKFSICVQNAIEIEAMMHKRFKNKRQAGEWFDLSELDIYNMIQIGIREELKSYIKITSNEIREEKKKNRMNDIDYIDLLESMLVMNSIKFEARC